MVDLTQLSDAELVARMSGTLEEQEVVQCNCKQYNTSSH